MTKPNENITGRLEGWKRDGVWNIVWGFLYDDVHKRWNEGQWIHTSRLKHSPDEQFREGDVIQTLNSRYLLGKPFSIFEK